MALFDVYFLFLAPIGFYALGAWFVLAPYWAENFLLSGFDEKTYLGDPLNELHVQLYGLGLVAIAALFDFALRRAVSAGDGRTAGILLGGVCTGTGLMIIIFFGSFHSKYNPPFAFGPALFLAAHVVTSLLSGFFGWRYWAGQAPVQPQAPAPRPWDFFTVVFLMVKPGMWMLVMVAGILWPVEFMRWAAPAFVGTPSEPLYTFAPTVLFKRLSAAVFLAFNAAFAAGCWRADQATLRRIFVTLIAAVVAVAWVFGDYVRRHEAGGTLLSAPGFLLSSFVLEILADVFALYAFLGGPVAGSSAPAAAANPYGYPTRF
eukprot:tig00000451_g973.t1